MQVYLGIVVCVFMSISLYVCIIKSTVCIVAVCVYVYVGVCLYYCVNACICVYVWMGGYVSVLNFEKVSSCFILKHSGIFKSF